jgi:diguanylate cyclase (GGDEF)-like protein
MKDWQTMLVPTLALISALAVLVYGNLERQLTFPALVLAAGTVLAVGIHLIATLRENLALLAHSQRLSLTDSLTGLGNRRLLIADLRLVCRTARIHEPWELVLYDLDGFKLYNDTFGHPAGDTLLRTLSERLKDAVGTHGAAYRMGGDEFCVLYDCSRVDSSRLLTSTVAALCEQGTGFSITASHGVVRIPCEMSDPASVMQLADQRLYRCKAEVAARRTGAHAELGAAGRLLAPTLPPGHPAGLTDIPSAGFGLLVDVDHGEDALALGQHDGGALAGTSPEQGSRNRRVRRQPPL